MSNIFIIICLYRTWHLECYIWHWLRGEIYMRQEIQDRGRGFLKSVSFRNRLGPRIEDKSLEKKYKSNTFERF